MIPTRFTNLDEARRRFGDAPDRLAPFLVRGDPLADAVADAIAALPPGRGWSLFTRCLSEGIDRVEDTPPAFRALFAEVDRVPPWVDWETLERGGNVLLRAGFFGGVVLGARSLVFGYCSPGGNKPLAFSGRLRERAGRRLGETGRFVHATCAPGGLRRFAPGFDITLRVRLMHAQVRRLLRASGRWDVASWGEPINQHDLVGTSLLFSQVALDGLRRFGFSVSAADAEAYLHLWRYSGYLTGVDPELLPSTEREALRLWRLIELTEGEPDADSRELTLALLDAPLNDARTPRQRASAARFVRISYGLCRGLVGSERADKLGVPGTRWAGVVPALRRVIGPVDAAVRRVPALDRAALRGGNRYWEWAVGRGLSSGPADFAPPTAPIGRGAASPT